MSCIRVGRVSGAIALLSALAAAQPRPLRLDDLVGMALERNREFLALRQRIAAAQGLLRQAGVRPAPTVEVQGATGRPLGSTGEEQFTAAYFHPIETFGKREKRMQVASKSVDLARAELADRVRRLRFEITSRYIDLAAGRIKLEVIRRLLGVNREYHRLTQARVEQGDAAPLEVQLLATDLNRAEAQQALLAGQAESALLDLKRAAGLPASQLPDVETTFIVAVPDFPLAELQKRALEQRPDLETRRLLEQQAAAELALAEAEARPDVTLSAAYSRNNSRFDQFGLNPAGTPVALRDRDHILTFGVAVPIFSASRNRGNIQAASSRLAAARLRREHLEATIPQEVQAAFQRWAATRRAAEILGSGVVEQSEKNVQVLREAYNLGQLRLLDVLNEQRRLIETRLSYVDAQAEQLRSLAELEQAVGGPTR